MISKLLAFQWSFSNSTAPTKSEHLWIHYQDIVNSNFWILLPVRLIESSLSANSIMYVAIFQLSHIR